jgi:hypothetical protein
MRQNPETGQSGGETARDAVRDSKIESRNPPLRNLIRRMGASTSTRSAMIHAEFGMFN